MRRSLACMIVFVCAAVSSLGTAMAGTTPPNGLTAYIPDYLGKVFIDKINYKVSPPAFTRATISVASRNCHPNSVAVHNNDLYVVCNDAGDGTLDQILVYNATTHAFIKTITGLGTDGNQYFSGAGLIGIVFDKPGILWVSAYNSGDLLRVPKPQLSAAKPKVDREIVQSPSQPAGLAIDTDNSMWIVGQFDGGIVLNFTQAVFDAPGSFLGATALNPTPRYCISNSASGCQQADLFNNPEGVAVFDGSVWVSNNGGNAPAATIVRLVKQANDQLAGSIYGRATDKPFACPGGMFAAGIGGAKPTSLWVNDEGYDVPNTDCGASSGDQGDMIGRLLEFQAPDLLLHKASPQPEKFTHWNMLDTSSPGFGGIYVTMN